MISNESTGALVSAQLLEPVFTERWLRGLYTFSGTFTLDGTDLTPERVREDLGALYDSTRAHRHRRFPRGVARYFLVPVYCATSFQKATRDYLYGYDRPGRWAIAMKPVLYNSHSNDIEAYDAVQDDTLFYYEYLKQLFEEGVSRAAQHFGHRPELTTDAHDRFVAWLLKLRNG